MARSRSIAILSIESDAICTERNYFSAPKINLSLKYDEMVLGELDIKNVFFESVDFSFTKNKIKTIIERWETCTPALREIYVICDYDTTSPSIDGIVQKVNLIKTWFGSKFEINHLRYQKFGENFEYFLAQHFDDWQKAMKHFSSPQYQKNDINIYKKVMKENQNGLQILRKNLVNRKLVDFHNFFKPRPKEYIKS